MKIFTEKLWFFIGISIVAFSVIYFAFVGYLNDIQMFAENKCRKIIGVYVCVCVHHFDKLNFTILLLVLL